MPEYSRAARRGLVLAVVAAACLPYLLLVGDYFLQDDFGVVQLMARRSWTTFPRWFGMPWTEDIWGYTPDEVRPFVAFTYQLTGKFAPSRPELHHLFNIALHAGNALLVMAIARTVMMVSLPAAAFAGLVFAVLPGQAESVVWITGRVDSMPAFFYFATFLAYARWRRHDRWTAYGAALALFFVALFSKQNTITMVATLAAYDLVILTSRTRTAPLRVALAWVPFGMLTAGFLLLRRAMFGQSLRPGLETPDEIARVMDMLGRHVQRTLVGHTGTLSALELMAAALVLGSILVLAARGAPGSRSKFPRAFCFFGVIWLAIGLAPVALAGYESERHAYLASAGWAFGLALVGEGLWARFDTVMLRRAILVCAAAVLVVYVSRLAPDLQGWHVRAEISRDAAVAVQREAAGAPPGTLLLVGVPRDSWEWASPFVLRPPFAPGDLASRVNLITSWRLHCCGPQLWNIDTRRQLQVWMDASPRPPIVALRFASGSGEFSRVTDAEFPELTEIAPVLLQTRSAEALDNVIGSVLERIVAHHRDLPPAAR